jgi:hypothetical protein
MTKIDWYKIGDIPIPRNVCVLFFLPDGREERRIQSGIVHDNITIIGNLFSFDQSKPSHWAFLPNGPDEYKTEE